MASGSGSVYQRKGDGRWCASLSLPGGRRVVRYADSKREAQRLLADLQREHALGRLLPPARMTFGEWAAEWLEQAATQCRPKTVENYTYGVRPVVGVLGRLRLDRMEPLVLTRTLREIARASGPGRMRSIVMALTTCLNGAVRAGHLPQNPLARADVPRSPRRDRRYWSLSQAQAFVAEAERDGGHYGPFFIVALTTGLRRGELWGLRWDDIDLSRRVMLVERAVVFVRNRAVEQDVKTDAGRRSVALPMTAIRVLQHLPRPLDSQAPVFRSTTGEIPFPATLRRRLHWLCERAGVPPISVHGLRHVAAALLIAEGVDVHSVQQRLGHARASMTLDTYSYQLVPDARAADAVDHALGDALGEGQREAEGG